MLSPSFVVLAPELIVGTLFPTLMDIIELLLIIFALVPKMLSNNRLLVLVFDCGTFKS